jgi:hypothetical protein
LDLRAPWDADSLLAVCLAQPSEQGSRKPVKHKPFAIQLYERFTKGETVEQLAATLNIPVEHVAMRIRAGEHYMRQHGGRAA